MSWHPFGRSGAGNLTDPRSVGGRRVPVVYIEAGNPECGRTLDAFSRAGVDIERVDVAVDQDARRALELISTAELLPVVDTGERQWSGHRADLIRAFVEAEAGLGAQEAS